MYDWLTLDTKNDSDGQHYPQTSSARIAETSITLPDTTAVEKMDDGIVETVATTPKRSPSPSLSEQKPSKDDEQHYPQSSPSPIAVVSNTLLDIAAVTKMDVDTLEIAPFESPNLPREASSKQLEVSMASDLEDFMTSEDFATSKDFVSTFGPVGISHSAISSKKLRARMRAGTYTINKARQKAFKSECLLSDLHAEFRYGEKWKVFHSRCGKWLAMTEAYNSTRFRQHIKGCKKMTGSSKFTTLNSFFMKGPAKQKERKVTVDVDMVDVAPQTAEYPCLGITASHDQRVSRLINRTGAEGGGARSVTKIANELFNKSYGELSERKKSQVDAAQMHE